jgi:hypothetical protein
MFQAVAATELLGDPFARFPIVSIASERMAPSLIRSSLNLKIGIAGYLTQGDAG